MRPTRPTPFKALIAASVLAAFGAPGIAAAQETIATAAHAPDGGAPAAPVTSELRLFDGPGYGPGFLRPTGPCGGPARTEDGKTDKTPHGEVWAGVGTRGYRDVGGAVCVPIGDNGAVSIAVDAGQINGRTGRRW